MTITKKNIYLIGITALLICFAVIFYYRNEKHRGKVFIYAVPFKTEKGWGFNILTGDRVIIKQPFIPAVQGKQAFQSSDDALLVGNLMVHQLAANHWPMISPHDIDSLGVHFKR